jgi:hypothetical protein
VEIFPLEMLELCAEKSRAAKNMAEAFARFDSADEGDYE